MSNKRLKGQREQRLMSGTGPQSSHVFEPRKFVAIRAGYREVFRRPAQTTWAEIENDLSQYSLGEVLDMVGRISAVLDNAETTGREVQLAIATGVLGPDTPDVMRRVEEISRESGNPTVVLFEPLQLLSVSKAAMLLLPLDGTLRADT